MLPEKITDLTPVPFDQRLPILTKAERNIITLLTDRIKTGVPINKDDIIDCYIKTVAVNGKKMMDQCVGDWTKDNGYTWKHIEVDLINHYMTPDKAKAWFQRNIGGCILKGGLVVIPVIEI